MAENKVEAKVMTEKEYIGSELERIDKILPIIKGDFAMIEKKHGIVLVAEMEFSVNGIHPAFKIRPLPYMNRKTKEEAK